MTDTEETQVGDAVITPVTVETTDDNGNAVVTGFPSGSAFAFEGGFITSADMGRGRI